MGSAESKPVDEGIVTVATSSISSRKPGSGGASSTADTDQLLAHLLALRNLVPDIEQRVGKSDPSSVWRDIESAKQLGADTQELTDALGTLLGAYREWHAERAAAVCTNQDYINRHLDQAEAKAAKALRHVRLQLQRIRALNAALKDAAALPALLSEVTEQASALQRRCDALSALAEGRGGGGGAGRGR